MKLFLAFTLKLGPVGGTETSVSNLLTPRNNPEAYHFEIFEISKFLIILNTALKISRAFGSNQNSALL
jgi:hypothetical protein